MERGELVPTKIIQQVILATVTDTKYAQKGFILNGVCRCQETFEFGESCRAWWLVGTPLLWLV